MKRISTRFIAYVAMYALLVSNTSSGGRAQAITGTMVGTATDATGAVIPDAKITITNKENGSSIDRTSDSTGQYTAPFLPPGRYRVQIEAPGFNAVAND